MRNTPQFESRQLPAKPCGIQRTIPIWKIVFSQRGQDLERIEGTDTELLAFIGCCTGHRLFAIFATKILDDRPSTVNVVVEEEGHPKTESLTPGPCCEIALELPPDAVWVAHENRGVPAVVPKPGVPSSRRVSNESFLTNPFLGSQFRHHL